MDELIEFGELLFDGVSKVSDYLFDQSFYNPVIDLFVSFLRTCQFEIFGVEFGPSDQVIEFLDMFSGGSIVSVIISGGIVAILGYRVIRFILDVFF